MVCLQNTVRKLVTISVSCCQNNICIADYSRTQYFKIRSCRHGSTDWQMQLWFLLQIFKLLGIAHGSLCVFILESRMNGQQLHLRSSSHGSGRVYQSVFTRKIDTIQDTRIYEKLQIGLQGPPAESDVEEYIQRVRLKVQARCSTSPYLEAGGSAMEAEECARSRGLADHPSSFPLMPPK